MTTNQTIAERTNTTIPEHLEAQATPPIAVRGFRQGDVYVMRYEGAVPERATGIALTGAGHKVVAGEADRNSHILNGDGTFHRCAPVDARTDYGLLVVPDNGVCYLTHTDEHGSVGFGPGVWRLFGQVEYGEELRRAAD